MDLDQMKTQGSFMSQFANTDPKMQMLAQLIANNHNSGDKAKSGTIAKLKNKVRLLFNRVKKLEVQKKHLLKYIDFFLDVNAAFSSAVGACECWGEDPECEKCGGEGLPGHFKVNEEAFNTYIKPCLGEKVKKIA